MEKVDLGNFMSYSYLTSLRKNHPAWKLLTSHQAPFIASFFYAVFLKPKQREIPEGKLVSQLENFIDEINFEEKSSFTPQEILTQWSNSDYAYLRKYYPKDKDEIHYDLTPAAQKAVEYLMSFEQKSFMATESRLRTVFNLLKEIVEKSNENPEFRIQELEKQKKDIENKIEGVKAGKIEILSPIQIKDRFLQAMNTSHEILSDFRIVEQNFRNLERKFREKIVTWDSGKGELLHNFFEEEEGIQESEQGKSFKAFSDFLSSNESQKDFKNLIEQVLSMKEIIPIQGSLSFERIKDDWMKGSEHVLDTLALLSKQLNLFINENSYAEERRIKEIIKNIEATALQLDGKNIKNFIEMKTFYADINFPMNKKLYSIPNKIFLDELALNNEEIDIDFSALYLQLFMDKNKLKDRINNLLLDREEISLKELVEVYPIKSGLTELLTYFVLAKREINAEIYYDDLFELSWVYENGDSQSAKVPMIIFKNSENEDDRDG